MPKYNLNIKPVELVTVMKGIGNTVRWLRKLKNPNATHDTTKWCEFHSDHGHNTTNCIALRLEVTELLKKGYLHDLLSDTGKGTLALPQN